MISVDITEPLKRWLGLRGGPRLELVEAIQPVAVVGSLLDGAVAPYGIPWGKWVDSSTAPGAGNNLFLSISGLAGYIVRVESVKAHIDDTIALLCNFNGDTMGGTLSDAPIRDGARWPFSQQGNPGTVPGLPIIRTGSDATANFAATGDEAFEVRTGDLWGQSPGQYVWLNSPAHALMLRSRSSNVVMRWSVAGTAFPRA